MKGDWPKSMRKPHSQCPNDGVFWGFSRQSDRWSAVWFMHPWPPPSQALPKGRKDPVASILPVARALDPASPESCLTQYNLGFEVLEYVILHVFVTNSKYKVIDL